jgi:RNA polymerase sigma-70 factor (ECF subfamily)
VNPGAIMPGDITELLVAHGRGREGALDELVPLVYADLRRMARAQARKQSPGASLDTCALVHEAYLRLVDERRAEWQDRRHFYAVASMAMRQIIIDHARRRSRSKRGGDQHLTVIDDVPDAVTADAEQLLDLDRALGRMEAEDPRLVRVVECRYFGGLTEQETADALGMSLRTVQREWLKARAWLRRALQGSEAAT